MKKTFWQPLSFARFAVRHTVESMCKALCTRWRGRRTSSADITTGHYVHGQCKRFVRNSRPTKRARGQGLISDDLPHISFGRRRAAYVNTQQRRIAEDWIKSLELPSTVHTDPTSDLEDDKHRDAVVRGRCAVAPSNRLTGNQPGDQRLREQPPPRRFTSHYYTKITTYFLYILYTYMCIHERAQQLVRGELVCYIGDYTERPLARVEIKSNALTVPKISLL